VLVASVTVVFSARPGADATRPGRVADALLARESVSTVHINPHGSPSGCRVDVAGESYALAVTQATDVVEAVAEALGLKAEVLSVGLVTDDDRVEIFRQNHKVAPAGWTIS